MRLPLSAVATFTARHGAIITIVGNRSGLTTRYDTNFIIVRYCLSSIRHFATNLPCLGIASVFTVR